MPAEPAFGTSWALGKFFFKKKLKNKISKKSFLQFFFLKSKWELSAVFCLFPRFRAVFATKTFSILGGSRYFS